MVKIHWNDCNDLSICRQKIRKERKGLINHVLKRGNGMPSSSQRSHAIDSSGNTRVVYINTLTS